MAFFPFCVCLPLSIITQVRPIHTAKGRNLLLLARRYSCVNPGCSKVQKLVKKKMKTPHGAAKIYVGVGADKRLITEQERACMLDGAINNVIPAATIFTFLNNGWSFKIDDER